MILDNDLLDRIYEAAVVPDEWPQLLEGLSTGLRSLGGVLFTDTPRHSQSISSPGFLPIRTAFENAGWGQKNSRVQRIVQRGLVGFTVTDQDLFSAAEMDADPMYEFVRRIGGGWAVGFAIQIPNGDSLALSFEGSYKDQPFDATQIAFVESIRPHISRSALLSARLGLDRARAAAEAMALIGLPTAVLSRSHRLLTCNSLFEDYIPAVALDARDRLRLTNGKADLLLEENLQRLQMRPDTSATLSIPIAMRDGRDAVVLHVVPIRRSAGDVFLGASCLIVATPVDRKRAVPAELLQGLFDLTAAEARIARRLSGGETVNEIAARTGVGIGTVRNQLKAIFAKTGMTRQAELVALLGNVSL